jgi:hypothetical protein
VQFGYASSPLSKASDEQVISQHTSSQLLDQDLIMDQKSTNYAIKGGIIFNTYGISEKEGCSNLSSKQVHIVCNTVDSA